MAVNTAWSLWTVWTLYPIVSQALRRPPAHGAGGVARAALRAAGATA
jgi:hypothetical protein